MHCKNSLCMVLILILCSVCTIASIFKFVLKKDKRIIATTYGEAVTQSLAACSAVCLSSNDCTAANYLAETRTCHLFNKTCFLIEDAFDWTYLSQPTPSRTFHYISNGATWYSAKTYCESIGGGLANVYTRADHDMILSVLGQSLNSNGVWLAGSDINSEGEWIWSNGCRFNDQDLNFWLLNEPNNDNNQDCLRLRIDRGIKGWDDLWCTDLLNFVCEIIVG